jgi:hypothetical protein
MIIILFFFQQKNASLSNKYNCWKNANNIYVDEQIRSPLHIQYNKKEEGNNIGQLLFINIETINVQSKRFRCSFFSIWCVSLYTYRNLIKILSYEHSRCLFLYIQNKHNPLRQ